MATHSSILAWRIPWTEEPGGLQSMGSQSQTQLTLCQLIMHAGSSVLTGYQIWAPLHWERSGLATGPPEKSLPNRGLRENTNHFPETEQTVESSGVRTILWSSRAPLWTAIWEHLPSLSVGRCLQETCLPVSQGKNKPGFTWESVSFTSTFAFYCFLLQDKNVAYGLKYTE